MRHGCPEDRVVIVNQSPRPVSELLHRWLDLICGERGVVGLRDPGVKLPVVACEPRPGHHHRVERADVGLGDAHVPAADVPQRKYARGLQPNRSERSLVLAEQFGKQGHVQVADYVLPRRRFNGLDRAAQVWTLELKAVALEDRPVGVRAIHLPNKADPFCFRECVPQSVPCLA